MRAMQTGQPAIAFVPRSSGCWLTVGAAMAAGLTLTLKRGGSSFKVRELTLVLCATLCSGVAAGTPPGGPPPAGTLKQSGESVDVWAAIDTLHRCGRIDVPDIPARAFDDNNGLTHMIIDSTGFTEMNGRGILMNGSAARKCTPSWNETKGKGCYFLVFVPTIRKIRDFYREM
eukprot:SAG31_NODE_4576_length_3123_cov_1.569775_1_plen_173_part_00